MFMIPWTSAILTQGRGCAPGACFLTISFMSLALGQATILYTRFHPAFTFPRGALYQKLLIFAEYFSGVIEDIDEARGGAMRGSRAVAISGSGIQLSSRCQAVERLGGDRPCHLTHARCAAGPADAQGGPLGGNPADWPNQMRWGPRRRHGKWARHDEAACQERQVRRKETTDG